MLIVLHISLSVLVLVTSPPTHPLAAYMETDSGNRGLDVQLSHTYVMFLCLCVSGDVVLGVTEPSAGCVNWLLYDSISPGKTFACSHTFLWFIIYM